MPTGGFATNCTTIPASSPAASACEVVSVPWMEAWPVFCPTAELVWHGAGNAASTKTESVKIGLSQLAKTGWKAAPRGKVVAVWRILDRCKLIVLSICSIWFGSVVTSQLSREWFHPAHHYRRQACPASEHTHLLQFEGVMPFGSLELDAPYRSTDTIQCSALEMEAQFRRIGSWRYKMRPAERRQEVVQCFLVGRVDHCGPGAPPVAVAME